MAFVRQLQLVLEQMLGSPCSSSFTDFSIFSAICCLTCGIIAAILPLVIPSCKDVEHTCPHCILPPHYQSDG